jgi:hypothetical protein
MQGKVEKVVLLQQVPGDIKTIRRGQLFRVLMKDTEGNREWSGWQVALADAVVSDNGKVEVNSDELHLIIGRPEIVNMVSQADKQTQMKKASDLSSAGMNQGSLNEVKA